jgi:hypothetical protein
MTNAYRIARRLIAPVLSERSSYVAHVTDWAITVSVLRHLQIGVLSLAAASETLGNITVTTWLFAINGSSIVAIDHMTSVGLPSL